MPITKRPRLHRVLDRLFPHDTLVVGGHPYMHRWYVWGYAPTPDDPDAAMVCGTCKLGVQQGERSGLWWHVGHGAPVQNNDHAVVAISAPRSGWRWQDHGVGAFRVHCTVAGDDSRAFHDHPWDFVSIGVRGSYMERRPAIVHRKVHDGATSVTWCPTPDSRDDVTTEVFRAPFVNRKAAEDLHVLDVVEGPVWTLFFTRPKVRSWGFAGPFGWLPWRTFDAEYPERQAWTEQGS